MSLVLLFIVLLSCSMQPLLLAQRPQQRSKQVQQTYGEPYYADALILPRATSDSADVRVLLRFNTASLVFSKVNSYLEQRGSYCSVIALSIEARDAVGVVRQRIRYADTVWAEEYEKYAERNRFHEGHVDLQLAPGIYTITLEQNSTKDDGLRKLTLPKTIVPKAGQKSVGGISCIFAQATSQEYQELKPCVFNANLPFPAGRNAIIATIPGNITAKQFDIWVRQRPYEEGDIRWWTGVEIHATSTGQSIQLEPNQHGTLSVNTIDVPDRRTRNLVIPFNASEVVPGRYLLTIVPDGSKDTLKYTFNVEWESMPISLRSLSYALDVLAYICPEESLDSLREGDEAEQREHLMEWWRRQDKTKETAHNERMAEYYRRVDRASYEYATLTEPDGAFTDRGKVFILYGAPTKTDRKTSKSGDAVETWIYTSGIRSIFVFTIEDGGRYRLTTVQPLRK